MALWDADGSELEEEAESLNISIYSSYEDEVLLNKEIGLLIILCPPIHHAQIAVKALGIAKHVYVHPPCATSASQTLRMVQSASYYPNLCAFVGSLRCLPAALEMKRKINEGYLGPQIIHCDVRLASPSLIGNTALYSWKCSEEMGGGVLNFFGSQLIDLVLFLLGYSSQNKKVMRVNAAFRTVCKRTAGINGIRHITADDVANVLIETESNCLITISLNSNASSFSQEVIFSGSEGQLVLRNANLYGKKLPGSSEEAFYVQVDEKMSTSATEQDDNCMPRLYLKAYDVMFDQMKEALLNENEKSDEQRPLASFEDALYVSEIIWAARQSAVEKNWCGVYSTASTDK